MHCVICVTQATSEAEWRRLVATFQSYAVLEKEWAFTIATKSQQFGTWLLGGLNAVGVVVLSNFLRDPRAQMYLSQSSLGFMYGLMPYLQVRFSLSLLGLGLFN